MPKKSFAAALNDQIANEFGAAMQYIGVAVHYDAETLPRMAAFFYRQALEERGHAMMMIQYLLDADAPIRIPGIKAPKAAFSGLAEPVRVALDQEQRVSDQIAELAKLARDGGDLLSEQFMQWFLKEQVEEVATMSALLTVVERSADRPMDVEEYLVREGRDEAADPTAPPAAGGAL
jgi:ferritin